MKSQIHKCKKNNALGMSKKIVLALMFFVSLNVCAQKPCEIDTNVTDSLGTYKSTKQFIIFERSFAGNSTNILFSLSSNNAIIGLEVQILRRSSEFIKADCFDTSSRIYLQLNNGKIVTLLFVGNDTCGTLIHNGNSPNSRIISGSFVFAKENYQDLKVSPVTFMRIKFAGETVDYPFKTQYTAELDKKTYEPENYFINYLKCVEN